MADSLIVKCVKNPATGLVTTKAEGYFDFSDILHVDGCQLTTAEKNERLAIMG